MFAIFASSSSRRSNMMLYQSATSMDLQGGTQIYKPWYSVVKQWTAPQPVGLASISGKRRLTIRTSRETSGRKISPSPGTVRDRRDFIDIHKCSIGRDGGTTKCQVEQHVYPTVDCEQEGGNVMSYLNRKRGLVYQEAGRCRRPWVLSM